MPIVVTSPVTAVVSTADELADGSVGDPSVAPLSDGTTGLYFAGATVNVACAGVASLAVSGSAINCKGLSLTNVGGIAASAAGTDLTDTGTQSINIAGGAWRKLPTLGQNGALTLLTTGSPATGAQITITRTDTSAFTYDIINGGAGAGTLAVFPVSKKAFAVLQYDGTNWALRQIGTL